ncbi:MAG: hypothetical protein JWL69_149 [Phycisphaerales bacterium]|nr:hypothetical protein [Phycisphaerales bacterium]MDB5355957.1 hypothetical protein [Phycisphaerales bacterium]
MIRSGNAEIAVTDFAFLEWHMTPATPNEIRADYDRQTIVVYQAYRPQIAEAALAAGKFVPPFSFGRMTWIKPSFLWLMELVQSGNERKAKDLLPRERVYPVGGCAGTEDRDDVT